MPRAPLLLLATLLVGAYAPRPGKEHATDGGQAHSDAHSDDAHSDTASALSEDDEDPDEDGLHPFHGGYEAWCKHREELSRTAGGSCSADGAQLGRPPKPENEVDEDAFALAVWQGDSETDLLQAFGMSSIQAVKRTKKRLNLVWVGTGGERPALPTLEDLDALWEAAPCTRTIDLAMSLGVGIRTLQLHFEKLGFSPKVAPDDGPVLEALEAISSRGWCSNLGVSFAWGELRTHFGIYATYHTRSVAASRPSTPRECAVVLGRQPRPSLSTRCLALARCTTSTRTKNSPRFGAYGFTSASMAILVSSST